MTKIKKNKKTKTGGRFKKQKNSNKNFVLAESFDDITYVTFGDDPETRLDGDYNTWDNRIWSYDTGMMEPIEVLGTSRGTCHFMINGPDGPGHCTWTIDMPEKGKIVISSDTSSMAWEDVEPMVVVGGTGIYRKAQGLVDVSVENDLFIYEFDL